MLLSLKKFYDLYYVYMFSISAYLLIHISSSLLLQLLKNRYSLLTFLIRLFLIYKKQMKSGIVWIVVMKDHRMEMINFMCMIYINDEHF